jgi:hypothetical protein
MPMTATGWRKTACNLWYVNRGIEVLVEEARRGAPHHEPGRV